MSAFGVDRFDVCPDPASNRSAARDLEPLGVISDGFSVRDCVTAMKSATPDCELLRTLADIPEIELSGFTAREGLAGTGVTMLKGRNYFGSWRADGDGLVWVSANLTEPSHAVPTVDEALRHTLLLILRNLETKPPKATPNTALAS